MWTGLHGYRWVTLTFLPALRALSSSRASPNRQLLLAKSYSLLGDIYFVFGVAPCAALGAYRRALRLDSKNEELLRDIGDMLFILGRYEASWKVEDRLSCLHATLGAQASEAIPICTDRRKPSHPLCMKENLFWLASEHLARCQPRAALRRLENKRGVRACRLRMMAFGAMEDAEAAMRECHRVEKMRGSIEWSSADWFFLPSALWNEPDFWRTMLRMTPRFTNVSLDSPRSEIQGPPELLDRAGKTNWAEIHRLAFEFHLACALGDTCKLQSLSRAFPLWPDCRVALQHLRRTGRPPTRDDLLRYFQIGGEKLP